MQHRPCTAIAFWSHDQHLVGSTAEPSIVHGAAMPQVPRELVAVRVLRLAFPLHLDIVPRDDGLHLLGSHLSPSPSLPPSLPPSSSLFRLRVAGCELEGLRGAPSVIIKNLLLVLFPPSLPPPFFLSEVETGTEPSRQHTSGQAHPKPWSEAMVDLASQMCINPGTVGRMHAHSHGSNLQHSAPDHWPAAGNTHGGWLANSHRKDWFSEMG
ncbi:hypothetical protein B296_00017716 [Ensete ventricosum]|uniref:Uncharacterized protein n=1 Tax=Ensete ventricosum TaxID=4639 RepID=A0A427ARA9_ENSVE|nr:hypothetical protein B296_00017716 [Ensete ventricosum]